MSYNGTMNYFKDLLNETIWNVKWMIIGIMALLTFIAIVEIWIQTREIRN